MMRLSRTEWVRVAGAIVVCAAVGGTWGCGPSRMTFDDPVEAMVSPDLSTKANLRAMEAAAIEAPEDPERIENLRAILSHPGASYEMRVLAWQQLVAHDEAMAKEVLMYRLPSIRAWDFVAYACDEIVQRGWVDFTPTLIRSLSRPAPQFTLNIRPEETALLALHEDQSLGEILAEFIATPAPSLVHAQWRLAAWDLLYRLQDSEPLFALLESAEASGDPFLQTIQAGVRDFGVLPLTREEVRWLEALRQPEHSSLWERCRSAMQQVPEAYQRDLRMRHVTLMAAVAQRTPSRLQETQGDLASQLIKRLADRPEYSVVGWTSAEDDRYDVVARLSWGDLHAALLLDDLLNEPDLRASLFAHADEDHEDTSTEYGGIIDVDESGRATATKFEPFRRDSDMRFHATEAMIQRGYAGLFHYHFHVQSLNNKEQAGPGQGDLQYAEAMQAHCVVFSGVGDDALNADYYVAGRLVVDMGEIRR